MKGYTRELGVFVNKYIDANDISLSRGDISRYTSGICEVCSLVFFPFKEQFFEGLKEKALICLWNLVLSDIVKCAERGRVNISDCMQVVSKYRKKENFNGKTESGRILHDFLQKFETLPSGPNKKISQELVLLDCHKMIAGLDYERVIYEYEEVGTLSEYVESGANTKDFRVFLDIDIALCPYNLNLYTIRKLREAYRWFGLAFRLNSDISALEKAFFEEKSLNAVILYGQEREVIPRDIFRADQEYKKRLFELVIPSLIRSIEDRKEEYLSKSAECLGKICELDIECTKTAFALLLGSAKQRAFVTQ